MTTCLNLKSEGAPVKVPYPYTRSYKDRHGKLRVEYRRNGKTIPLPNSMGTAEFQRAYDAAAALVEGGQSPTDSKGSGLKAGSLRWLSVEHFKSGEFKQLAPSTQREWRSALETMLREPARPNSAFLFGDYPAAALEAKHIRVLRDRRTEFPASANLRLKVLNRLFKWALQNEMGGLARNPARDVPKLKIKGDGHHTWTVEEIERYERTHPIGTKAHLAITLLKNTGTRRSDVVRLGKQHVKDGCLCFTAIKNRERKPVTLELPILPALQKVLDATPLGEVTFLVNERGRPFRVNKFSDKFREWCDQAGLPHCTAHGMRKAAATIAAENGATAHELMAIFGWKSVREAERYTRAAERKGLAARGMGRLVPIKGGTESV